MIYLGADHRGFQLKEEIREYLITRGYKVTDLGANSEQPVDYPVIAEKVAKKVVTDLNNRGVLICGSGAGVCIAANKIKGIRAAQAWNTDVARSARTDDNINVICLSADQITAGETKPIVQTFLDTSFGGVERFNRRIKEISDLEKKN